MSKDLRTALRTMSEPARKALEILQKYECAELVLSPAFCAALAQPSIQFLVFACLGTKRGKEEIKLNLFETIFFTHFRKRTERLCEELTKASINFQLLLIVPDLEPVRTWGWSVSPTELTGLCEMMIEEARVDLPKNWSARLWSDIEGDANYDEARTWAETEASPLIVANETAFCRELAHRYPDIATRYRPRELALRQIAGYAHEGRVLEREFPHGILLQNAVHVKREDKMYALLRNEAPLIAHPFTDE